MKACFICCEYPPGTYGGIGTSTQNLARALAASGHEVRVVGMYASTYAAPDYEEDQGVRVWRLRSPSHRLGWIRARIRLHRTVAAWARAGAIDLVDVPDWEGWAAGWPRLRVPVISRLCGAIGYFAAEMGRPANATMFRLERASLRRSDYWCSKSNYMAERTRRLFQLRNGPDAILHNPVDVPCQSRQDHQRSADHVVYTGTLTAKKGVIPLIKAWPGVLQSRATAELHLFGKDGRTDDGRSMKAFLLSLLDDQTRRSVHFHDHVDRARITRELLHAAVAVFPSYAEGFANGPLESMACGCPTIYSRRGSGPELIEDGRHGLLVDPDGVDEIANRITQLLCDDGLARRLSEAGRQRVRERFSTEHVLAKNEAFYERCVEDFHRIPARRRAGMVF